MEIKIFWKGRCYSITIGYETPWFGQIYWIIIAEEFYDDKREVYYADCIFHFWKGKRWKEDK